MIEFDGLVAYPEGRILLIGEGTRDDMQVSGRWIRSDCVRELLP